MHEQEKEKKLIQRVSSALRSLAHTCSGFGSYFMQLQSRCLKHGGCEGSPTVDEARRDYSRIPTYAQDSGWRV